MKQLNGYNLAYVHMIEPRAASAGGSDQLNEGAPNASAIFRAS
jgi:N-ethylmaleimide reductase